MVERNIVVSNALGIHARPASLIVQTAMKFKSSLTLLKGNATADAKSIMSVMMLAAAKNTPICIRANGPDESEAVDAMIELFNRKFNEE